MLVQVLCALMAPSVKTRASGMCINFWLLLPTHQATVWQSQTAENYQQGVAVMDSD